MRRKGTHEPSIETVVELSGIETLHPGGLALTRRTAELAGLAPGMRMLEVSSGRGTQAVFYAREFGADVTGIDLSEEMVRTATRKADEAGLAERVRFRRADSQRLPFESATFDAVVNECAVGIPEDSQAVVNEMVRVARPGAAIVMHESTWRAPLSAEEKDEIAERYGTTPLERGEWLTMLACAGLREVQYEDEPWSRPEMFWKVRADRDVPGPGQVLTVLEQAATALRVIRRHGLRGVRKAFENERAFYDAILAGKVGYSLYWARRPSA